VVAGQLLYAAGSFWSIDVEETRERVEAAAARVRSVL
jgi:hypothetical protein